MPRVLKPGDRIKDYLISKHLNTGAMANAFAAESPDKRKVFFKQYKSPAVGVKWFTSYVQYQKELNRRINEPALKRFCVRQLDSFVYKFGVDTFFQVYEFVEGGHDLETILAGIRRNPSSLGWSQRSIIAKVMMAGIHQLHEQKIAHCDLKPPNLQMFEDASIEAKYQLKLIDMDFSVLSDKQAPWHGHAPYVGTPRYFSPEHLKGETPTRRSDVFTCGIILYELLGEGHPFPAEDDAAYFEKIVANKVAQPKLIGSLATPSLTAHLAAVIRRCLSPDSNERPTAKEVNLALNGRADPTIVSPPPPPPKPEHKSPPDSPGTDGTDASVPTGSLRLTGASNTSVTFNISTALGKELLRRFGAESRFADDQQFAIERRGLEWWLIPVSGTTNYTVLNSKPVLTPTRLKTGDRIEIGSRSGGKTVFPLTVAI